MIEHHVHDDGEAGLMAGAHEVAELLHRDHARRGSVLIGHAERADGHVAPMIFFLVRMLELRARQELECVHPQRPQVIALRADITGEVAVAAGGRCALGEAEQIAQMPFENNKVFDGRRHEAVGERSQ